MIEPMKPEELVLSRNGQIHCWWRLERTWSYCKKLARSWVVVEKSGIINKYPTCKMHRHMLEELQSQTFVDRMFGTDRLRGYVQKVMLAGGYVGQ